MMDSQSSTDRLSIAAPPFWKNPSSWLRDKGLGRGYWIFFAAAFFFDAGFSVYFFLFNLYLLDRGFNERAMGWIGGALTLGSLAGTLPAGVLVRRIGLRPLLLFLFLAAPALNAMRAIFVFQSAQIALAFLAGLVMSCWGVCFLPAVARLTTEKNRTAAFSLIFSVSVGTSMLGGIVCGYLRQWLELAGVALQPAQVKELILLISCAIVLAGLFPAARLHVPQAEEGVAPESLPQLSWLRTWNLRPFLMRYLPLMALWSAVLAAFTPFANVYLERVLHVPMEQIGLVFSAVQVVQFCMGLAMPAVCRMLGLIKGIVATQAAAALVLGCMATARNGRLAIALYLTFSAAQWMSSPALYNLLMNETPDVERGTAAAMVLFCNALAGVAAAPAAGVLLTRFGYPPVLAMLATSALVSALLFLLLVAPMHRGARRKETIAA